MTSGSLLSLRDVSKAYPGVQALAGVDLDIDASEVHALLGENGAGKSTLMKIIAGSVKPDRGELLLDGTPLPAGSPARARRHGIGAVYQELSLISTMSVGENVLLGQWQRSRRMVDLRLTEEAAVPYLERIGLDVSAATPVRELGVAERQLVEIAKALSFDVRVLLLDEPTSALSEVESRRLFDVIRDLVDDGVAVIYVSHRLPEILEVADQITVLRDGERVGQISAAEASEHQLASMMIGRSVTEQPVSTDDGSPERDTSVVLRARQFGRPPRLKPLDLTLRKGEIAAVFGLVGAGRSRLARTLFGIEPASAGELELFGRRVELRSPADAIAAGIGYVGEDRSAGLISAMTVGENITLASMPRTGRGPLLGLDDEKALAEQYIKELNIRTPSVHTRVGALSGGNQQKVLLARWLCTGARLLLLDDPVRGVDVGAKEEVFRLVRELATAGVTILYITSEIREARTLGDRILVMADGSIVDELSPDASDDRVMTAAGGVDV
ncbi:sugar ABC transporter ATP-binding protein [Phytoactinopolyspora halophila]|nr:sugar ABC transporter ATP-binding protein [Phytoactinopolyspora halophila]